MSRLVVIKPSSPIERGLDLIKSGNWIGLEESGRTLVDGLSLDRQYVPKLIKELQEYMKNGVE